MKTCHQKFSHLSELKSWMVDITCVNDWKYARYNHDAGFFLIITQVSEKLHKLNLQYKGVLVENRLAREDGVARVVARWNAELPMWVAHRE